METTSCNVLLVGLAIVGTNIIQVVGKFLVSVLTLLIS
jgi:hypothetical protein